MNATYAKNAEHKGIEITFDSKPDAKTLDMLKGNGYHWHPSRKIWYAKDSAETLAVAKAITQSKAKRDMRVADVKSMFGKAVKVKPTNASNDAKVVEFTYNVSENEVVVKLAQK